MAGPIFARENLNQAEPTYGFGLRGCRFFCRITGILQLKPAFGNIPAVQLDEDGVIATRRLPHRPNRFQVYAHPVRLPFAVCIRIR